MVPVVSGEVVMKVRYLGSSYGAVRGPGGVLFAEPGDEGDVEEGWGLQMVETAQFEAAKPAKKKQETDVPKENI